MKSPEFTHNEARRSHLTSYTPAPETAISKPISSHFPILLERRTTLQDSAKPRTRYAGLLSRNVAGNVNHHVEVIKLRDEGSVSVDSSEGIS